MAEIVRVALLLVHAWDWHIQRMASGGVYNRGRMAAGLTVLRMPYLLSVGVLDRKAPG
jgi:hypothetical protein